MSNKEEEDKELTKEKKEIFDNMINYFELTPNNISIQIPYSYQNALDTIDRLSLDSISRDLREIIPIKEQQHYFYFNDQTFSLNNILF